MWLKKELLNIQVQNLSTRQQLDLLQDNAYIRCNLNSIIQTGITLNRVVKKEITSEKYKSRYAQEVNIAWNNICSYIYFAFPIVWTAICDCDILPQVTNKTKFSLDLSYITLGIQSFKKVQEVFKTLVYGGPLRFFYSQNSHSIQTLYTRLLHSCQITDIAGKNIIAGQNRIIFLQNWIEKLVLSSSLHSYFIANTTFASPINIIKREPVQITDKKYIVKKILKPTHKQSNAIDIIGSAHSTQSVNTTFSSYINSAQPKNFVGLKIKFDLEDSENSSCCTDNSDDSVWKPVFKKRHIS